MKRLALALLASTWVATATAASVTVAAGGGADFTNIADAIAGTGTGDTITVIDGGAYGAFSFNSRILVSSPPGASITSTVIVDGPVGTTTTIEGFTIDGVGNAIFHFGDGSTVGTLNLTNCTLSNIGSHGILYNSGEDGTLNATNCTFSNCGENAITLFRSATINLTGCTMIDNGLGVGGHGSIFIDGNFSTTTGRVITLDDTSISGGLFGIRSFRDMDLTLTNGSSVSDALIDGIFADAFAQGSTIMVEDSTVASNGVRGMFLARGLSLTVERSNIEFNGGDGIFLEDFANSGVAPSITIVDSVVRNNAGRGLFHNGKTGANSTVTVQGSTFSANGNRALSAEAVPGSSTVLYTIERNIVRDGSGAAESAIIAFTAGAGSVIRANLIDGGAVGIATNNPTLNIHNNTVVNASGGAIDIFDGGGNVIDIRNNILAQCGDGVTTGSGLGLGATTVNYNLAQVSGLAFAPAFAAGPNNITPALAGFVAPSGTVGAGDYHLAAGSPARNAGDPTLVLASDIEGKPYNPAPDMGAYSATGLVVLDTIRIY